jgi:hypothetical protein
MDDPPGIIASTAITAKSSTRLPLPPACTTSGIASAAAVSVVFVAAPTYAHPFAQSSPPYMSTGALTTTASVNTSAHA